ncbi:unnamed protein product, partial [Polarella glacialis]
PSPRGSLAARLARAAARRAGRLSARQLLAAARGLRDALPDAAAAAARCATLALRALQQLSSSNNKNSNNNKKKKKNNNNNHNNNLQQLGLPEGSSSSQNWVREAADWAVWLPSFFFREGDARLWVEQRFMPSVRGLLKMVTPGADSGDDSSNSESSDDLAMAMLGLPPAAMAYLGSVVVNTSLHPKALKVWGRALRRLALQADHVPAEFKARPKARLMVGDSRRARVGVLSSFLDGHSVAYWVHGNLVSLPRETVELVMIELPRYRQPGHRQATNVVYKRLRSRADHWVRVIWAPPASEVQSSPEAPRGGRGVAQVAHLRGLRSAWALLAEQRLDVLLLPEVGLCPLSYLAALWRVAPVQVAGFGHALSTGLPTVDHFLSYRRFETPSSDSEMDPAASSRYSEHLVQLPGVPLLFPRRPDVSSEHQGPLPAFQPPVSEAEVWAQLQEGSGRYLRPAIPLPPGSRTYCLPQSLYKLAEPTMDSTLAAMVRADPKAILVLLAGPEVSAAAAIHRRLALFGPRVLRALRFVPLLGAASFLSLLSYCSVVLDAFPHGGWTTTVDALSVGAPVLTMPGTMLAGRGTFGLYEEWSSAMQVAGVEDKWLAECCVATTVAEFVRKAGRLARNSAAVRQRFAEEVHHIFFRQEGAQAFARFLVEVATSGGAKDASTEASEASTARRSHQRSGEEQDGAVSPVDSRMSGESRALHEPLRHVSRRLAAVPKPDLQQFFRATTCGLCAGLVVEAFVHGIRMVVHTLTVPVMPVARGIGETSTVFAVDDNSAGHMRLRHRSGHNFGDARRDGPWHWEACSDELLGLGGWDTGDCWREVERLGPLLVAVQKKALADLLPHLRPNGSDDLLYLQPGIAAACGSECLGHEAELLAACRQLYGPGGSAVCAGRLQVPPASSLAPRKQPPPRWWRAAAAARLPGPAADKNNNNKQPNKQQ